MELDQVAFYIAQNYIISVSIIKNYILIADACSSVQFLVWHDEDCNIVPMAKDNYRSSAYSTGFVVDNRNISMIVSDMEGNIQAFRYNPKTGGEGYRLIPTADMYIGSDVITTIAHPLLLPSSSCVNALCSIGKGKRSNNSNTNSNTNTINTQYGSRMDKTLSTRSCLLVGSDRGCLGVLLPLDERVYRRLALLQQLLCMTIPTTFCLNPRDYRNMKLLLVRYSPMVQRKKGILDCNILCTYCTLESSVQYEIAVAMGTNVDIILENISDMDHMTNFF